MNNYKVLFSLRLLKSILKDFVASFFVLYFVQISNSNILPFVIYKLISVTVIYAVIFLCRNFAKSKHRVILMRIGIILDFIHFLAIIILNQNIVHYSYIIGILYGLEEGFYFSVFNMFESNGITNEERAKYMGTYTSIKAISSIIFPLIFGSTNFLNSIIIVLILIFFQIILSFLFKDTNIPNSNKTNIKEFTEIIKDNKKVKQVLKTQIYSGLTYSEGAFSYIITLYIIKVFSNNFSLGIFTSIFALITSSLGVLFAKCIKQRYYKSIIKISMVFTISSLLIMVYKCNMITIIIFNLFQTFSRTLVDLINNNNAFNISNINILKKEFKVEYFLSVETSLFIGRIISNSILLIMIFIDSNISIYIYIVFLILFAYNVFKSQKIIDNELIQEQLHH